ncbi:uncharacterized protein LOC135226878 [Macrobrachium nipponense]|uniref:uncharacterized protein LOC135226878 n=1 Tax=Macrobrachium nipponense TaxID=159736 RepID=UPI0030C8CB8F
MRCSSLLSTIVLVTWISASEAVLLGAALALGGLAALKGAALVGLAVHKHKKFGHHYQTPQYYGAPHGGYGYGHGYGYGYRRYRKGRSADDTSFEEYGEDLLLSTVGQLDPNGCVLKLLCQAHVKKVAARSLEEAILVDLFSNGTGKLTSQSAAFVFATDIGVKTQDPLACKKYFPNCPLSEGQLSGLLQMAWGCGLNVFQGDDGVIAEDGRQQGAGQVTEQEVPTTAGPQATLGGLVKKGIRS